jgi:hypothetical protein
VTDAGYSGTPLPKKLGLKDGQAAAFIALPPELSALTAAADFVQALEAPSAADLAAAGPVFDLILACFTAETDLREQLVLLRGAIRPNGMIWIGWPKRASKVPTDITEDVIRAVALPSLVDVKVCAISDVWSGLKLVIPRAQRAG